MMRGVCERCGHAGRITLTCDAVKLCPSCYENLRDKARE